MSQTVRARYDYDPYGNVTKISGDRDSVFLFTGHFWDARNGLYLTLYRAYDPVLGRWLSRDPIEEKGGVNLYGYVGNQPIYFVDPSGLRPWSTWDNPFWDALEGTPGQTIVALGDVLSLGATRLHREVDPFNLGLHSMDECRIGIIRRHMPTYILAALSLLFGPGVAVAAGAVNIANSIYNEMSAPPSNNALNNALTDGGNISGVGGLVAGVGEAALGSNSVVGGMFWSTGAAMTLVGVGIDLYQLNSELRAYDNR